MNSLNNFDANAVPSYVDFRLPENRMEAHYRVAHHRYVIGDLDHNHSAIVICDQAKLDLDQKAWYAIMFGFSYRTLFAHQMTQMWPNLAEANITEINDFWTAPWVNQWKEQKNNWSRMILGNDTKWHRGQARSGIQKITEAIQVTQNLIKDSNFSCLYDLLASKVKADASPRENRDALNEVLRSIPYVRGDMCNWLTLQCLYGLFDWNIDVWELPWSNWTSRQCSAYIFNDEECMNTKNFDREKIEKTNHYFSQILEYCNSKSDFYFDAYSIESSLCELKKQLLGSGPNKVPKEFTPSWASTEMSILLEESMVMWPEVDWTPALVGQMTKHESIRGTGYTKDYFRVGKETGMLMGVNESFPDMPDVYSVLQLPRPTDFPLVNLHALWNDKFSKDEQSALIQKYDPRKLICKAKRL